jgi:hypothetical protein
MVDKCWYGVGSLNNDHRTKPSICRNHRRLHITSALLDTLAPEQLELLYRHQQRLPRPRFLRNHCSREAPGQTFPALRLAKILQHGNIQPRIRQFNF